SGTRNATFTVSLSAASSESITVEYATGDDTAIAGLDYTAQSGKLTFNPGETSQTITIPVIGETIFEGNETFIVNLNNPNNATVANPQGIGTIDNDDSLPELSINSVTVSEGDSGTQNA
ncbi:MAG: calcium-binding protein, partial [Symploca sp. SIO1B1]|nr:calcium-binding protein [Symploca sp. SIO1B1]